MDKPKLTQDPPVKQEQSPHLEETSPPVRETGASGRSVDRRDLMGKFVKVGVGGLAAAMVGSAFSASSRQARGSAPGSGKKHAVRWGMIVDLKKCVGCMGCVVACKAENHTPPGVTYTVVLEEEIGEYPNVRRQFIPRPCMQCAKSSCAKVCPTKATYHRKEDGIVVVDYDKCIGCRYCIAACPYGSRSFDYGGRYSDLFTQHDILVQSKDRGTYESQPSPEYGENRPWKKGKSPIGNVRKCTFCLHRLKKGLAPACAETCMGRAIHFGDLQDPAGKCLVHGENLRELLATRYFMRLKEELGNDPAVYYLT